MMYASGNLATPELDLSRNTSADVGTSIEEKMERKMLHLSDTKTSWWWCNSRVKRTTESFDP